MTTRTHFAFRIDLWDPAGDNIVEHIAGVEDFQVAQATYRRRSNRLPESGKSVVTARAGRVHGR
jgi:hypothetical protein